MLGIVLGKKKFNKCVMREGLKSLILLVWNCLKEIVIFKIKTFIIEFRVIISYFELLILLFEYNYMFMIIIVKINNNYS